jgi:hypothetical protein
VGAESCEFSSSPPFWPHYQCQPVANALLRAPSGLCILGHIRTNLAALKAERASLAAQIRRIETEAAPIRYVAELLGTDTDSERAMRWLIALMVLCCDLLAIALTASASVRRSTV